MPSDNGKGKGTEKGKGKGKGKSERRKEACDGKAQAHQLRECKKCGDVEHWRRMEACQGTKYKAKETEDRAGTSARDGVQYGRG